MQQFQPKKMSLMHAMRRMLHNIFSWISYVIIFNFGVSGNFLVVHWWPMLLEANLILIPWPYIIAIVIRKRHIITEFRKECEYTIVVDKWLQIQRYAIKGASMPPALFQIHCPQPPAKQHFNLQKNFSWVANVINYNIWIKTFGRLMKKIQNILGIFWKKFYHSVYRAYKALSYYTSTCWSSTTSGSIFLFLLNRSKSNLRQRG